MKGLYLYCIRAKNNFRSPMKVRGINVGEVWALPYKDLEAVVSLVSLDRFSLAEIQKKAQEDLGWIKEKAQAHERVIEKAMGKENGKIIPVIPMKFGTIFKTEENLEQTLEKHYNQFKESLERLRGKQEWGVKVFLKEDIFKKAMEEKNKVILAKKKEIESMPKGMAFFAQKQLDELVNQEGDKELANITEDIYEGLGGLASNKNKAKILEKDFTGRSEAMILNSFYSIKESKLDQFQKGVEESKEKYNFLGFAVEMTGPWPPYHFV